jgi:hypothetical protein
MQFFVMLVFLLSAEGEPALDAGMFESEGACQVAKAKLENYIKEQAPKELYQYAVVCAPTTKLVHEDDKV